MAQSFHLSFGTPVTTVRPFNTYGPRQSARAVIPTIVTQIAAGARTLKLGALTPTRDFNFVRDTVRGFVSVAECDAAIGEVLNIGSNHEISIGDTARLIAELMGVDIAIESDEQRLRPAGSEVERLWADNSRARALTGWTPEYAGADGLRRGLGETIAWFREPINLSRYKAGRYNL
jgi:nucleoside-diphosphate-sugar epimerase